MNARPAEAGSRSRTLFEAPALLDALSSSDASVEHSPLGATPWLYLRIDTLRSVPAQHRARLLAWVRTRACPVIGLGLPGDQSPLAVACDVVVAEDRDAQILLDSVERTPFAAMTLVQVMRATARLPIAEGLLVESLGYAMLQAGPEFRGWLAAHPRPAPAAAADVAPLRIERIGPAVTITLARPGRRNALSAELRDALITALELVCVDTTIASAVIEGDGPDFCSGGDLAEFGTAPDAATAHAVRTTRSPAAALIACRDRVRFRLHGACVGAGVELAAFGREVTATADTWFQLPELGFGLIPGAGGCVSLLRRIGRQRAAWLALSGQRIDAATALAWGLVDSVE